MRAQSCLFAVFIAFSACSTKPSASASIEAPTEAPKPNKGISLDPEKSSADCTLCVESNPFLVVDKDGAASGDMVLCNKGQTPRSLVPGLSDFDLVVPSFIDVPMSTGRVLTGTDGRSLPETITVEKDKCTTVRLQVSKFLQGGLATAQFTNAGTKLIDVKAVRYDLPFNLKVEGPTPEKVDMTFTRYQPGKIRLRNEDGMGYRFHWVLELGHKKHGAYGEVDPKGRVELSVPIDDSKYFFLDSGFLRSGSLSGQLILDFEPDASFRSFPKPQKVYPVTARLNYYQEAGQRFWTALSVLAVLLLGILLFLLINFVGPMQSERVKLKQRLANLEGKLAGLGETVESRLLSLLRVEKKRLREELRTLLPWFPQIQIEFPQLKEKVGKLERRIALTVQAGELLNALRIDGDRLSAHEADEVRGHCQNVFNVAGKPEPSDEEIKEVQKSLLTATQIFEQAAGKPTPERVASLRQAQKTVEVAMARYKNDIAIWELLEWKAAQPPYQGAHLTDEMLQGCQKIFPAPQTTKPPVPPDEPDRVSYNRQAKAVKIAELLMEFAQLVETSGDAKVKADRLKRLPDLLEALRPGSGESIRKAAGIVQQVEQNISRSEIEEAIKNAEPDKDMWIEKDPVTALALKLVTFRVRFKKPGLDAAVARKEIRCCWKIDGEVQENLAGWQTGSYFEERPGWIRHPLKRWRLFQREKKEEKSLSQKQTEEKEEQKAEARLYRIPVEATFPNLDGKTLSTKIEVERTKSYVESRTLLALASVLVTVFVVGFGLLATAQEKIQSLDWMSGFLAILVLGYTANAIKNLLTKT